MTCMAMHVYNSVWRFSLLGVWDWVCTHALAGVLVSCIALGWLAL
jgi:hypothetical protein